MKPALRNSLLSTVSNLFDDDFFNPSLFRDSTWPAANVREESDHFQVEVIAPGLKKEDFKLALANNTLTVSAENKKESEEKKESYRRREYSYRSFQRTFDLPEGIEADQIQAHYTDGVLNINIINI